MAMQSLADLLRNSPLTSGREIEDRLQQLLAHPQVAAFLDKHPQLDRSAIRGGMPRLYQFASEYDSCSNCPGLDRCPNDMTGHYTRLSVEQSGEVAQISESKVACRKYIASQADHELKQRIHSFYIDESSFAKAESLKDIKDFDKQRAKAVMHITKYIADTRATGLGTKGLYLFGDFGTGKTHLLCHMLKEMAKLGYHGVIVYMPEFMEDLKSMFQEPQKLKETIDMMKETDILIFDDIGAENLNPWLRDHVLGTILNYRMNRKPTFYTSNYDLNRLADHFSFTNKEGEDVEKSRRIMERIRPFVDVVVVEGTNKRG